MISHFPPSFRMCLLSFFQVCFESGTIPSSWKLSQVVAIPKPGKPRTLASSYRPIALTSHLSKVYERILKERLEHYVERNNLLPKCQAGFRKSRSISDHLYTLTSHVKSALKRKRGLTAVFFDVRRAFDTVWHKKLLFKLKSLGLSGNIFSYISSFLSGRSFQVRFGKTLSTSRTTDCGVPQGTVLAPLLFNLMLHDLPDFIQSKCKTPVTVTQFADDLAIWSTVSTRNSHTSATKEKTRKSIQSALDAVCTYMKNNGFSLAQDKTQLIHFSRNQDTYKPNLSLGDSPLKATDAAKFLGVIFTPTLVWSQHINSLLKKANKAMNLIKVVRREAWGQNPKTLLHLCQALVRSRLQHGQECFHGAPASLLKKLTSLDSRAIKLSLGLPVHCETEAAYAEAEVLPLDEQRQLSVAKFLPRSFTVDNSSTEVIARDASYDQFKSQTKNPQLLSATAYTAPLFQQADSDLSKVAKRPVAPMPPWQQHGTSVYIPNYSCTKSQNPSLLESEVKEVLATTYKEDLQVFTDGSVLQNGDAGSGFAIPSLGISKSFHLGRKVNIYTAELHAITMALEYVKSLPSSLRRVMIGVDSQAALKSIMSHKSSTRPDVLVEILHLSHVIQEQGTNLTFVWIPSHINVHGNNKADAAAKAGATASPSAQVCPLLPSSSEIGNALASAALDRWMKRRAEMFKTKKKPCFLPHKSHSTLSLPCGLGSLVRRLRTNSWRAKYCELKCDCCPSVPLSPEHVILHCPTHSHLFSSICRTQNVSSIYDLMANLTTTIAIAKALFSQRCSIHF